MLRVAIVGAGSIGREFALKHFTEELGVSVVAVVDRNLQLAKALASDVAYRRAGLEVVGGKYRETVDMAKASSIPADRVPKVEAVDDLKEVLDSVDFCYIGTPPTSHAAIAIQALEAGKHVLLEKPIAVSNSDAEAIVQAAEKAWDEHKAVININIGMRFSHAAIGMKKMIYDDNYIGNLSEMKLKLLFRQWPRVWQNQPWVAERQQGGPLLEVGTHWIFGLLEIVGFDSIRNITANTVYADGPEGKLCESESKGVIELQNGVKVLVEVESTNQDAITAGKDTYELHAIGDNGKFLVLYDFVMLRDGQTNEDLISGGYGRRECIEEMVKAIRAQDRSVANLITPAQAQRVQQTIAVLRNLS